MKACVAMCGIVLVRHGPRGFREWVDPISRVNLGHRRLAMIEADPRANPRFCWPEVGLSLVPTGGICNWKELRRELKGAGHRFMTRLDTELLIHASGQWGAEVVHPLCGMYAFTFWDGRNQEAFLASDPYWIKPLCSCFNGGIPPVTKSLLAGECVNHEPDPVGWGGFLLWWGSVPEPCPVYRRIPSLPAGSTLVWYLCGLQVLVSRFDFGKILVEEISRARSGSYPWTRFRSLSWPTF